MTAILVNMGRQRALDAVYANAKRQTQLIDDLLDVSRIVSGKIPVTRSAVDLHGLVRGALDIVQPFAEAKRIQIQSEIDASIGRVVGDAARFAYFVGANGNCGPTNNWACQTVLSVDEGAINFQLDSNNIPHLVAYDLNRDLRYAVMRWALFLPVTRR